MDDSLNWHQPNAVSNPSRSRSLSHDCSGQLQLQSGSLTPPSIPMMRSTSESRDLNAEMPENVMPPLFPTPALDAMTPPSSQSPKHNQNGTFIQDSNLSPPTGGGPTRSVVRASIRGRRPRVWSGDREPTHIEPGKTFICPEPTCLKMFGRNEHLNRHMRVHSGERPYACTEPGCTKRFTRSDNLVTHIKSHKKKSARQASGEVSVSVESSTPTSVVSASDISTSSTSTITNTSANSATTTSKPKTKRSVKAKTTTSNEHQPPATNSTVSPRFSPIHSLRTPSASRKLSTASLPGVHFSSTISTLECGPSEPALTDTPPHSRNPSPGAGASPRAGLKIMTDSSRSQPSNKAMFPQQNAASDTVFLNPYTQQQFVIPQSATSAHNRHDTMNGISLLGDVATVHNTHPLFVGAMSSVSQQNVHPMTPLQLPFMHAYSGYPYQQTNQMSSQNFSQVYPSQARDFQVHPYTHRPQVPQKALQQQMQLQQTNPGDLPSLNKSTSMPNLFQAPLFMPLAHQGSQMQQDHAAAAAVSDALNQSTQANMNLIYTHGHGTNPTPSSGAYPISSSAATSTTFQSL